METQTILSSNMPYFGSGNKRIKSIEIRNVGLHKDTKIEFDDGFNVITGGNMRGKSTVFRALIFVAFNRPTAGIESEMIRWGAKSLFIKVTMDDGSWVSREKGKDVNRYVVFDPAKHSEPLRLEGFSTSVPHDVTEILGMGPTDLLGNKGAKNKKKDFNLNVASQGEPFFMLSESSPDIARQMYAITCLHDVRGALDGSSRDLKAKKLLLKQTQEQAEETRRKVASFADLDDAQASLDDAADSAAAATEAIAELRQMQNTYEGLLEVREKAVPVKKRIGVLSGLLDQVPPAHIEGLQQRAVEIVDMLELERQIEQAQENIISARSTSRTLVQMKRVDPAPLIAEAEEIQKMMALFEQIAKAEGDIAEAEARMGVQRDKMAEITKERNLLQQKIFGDGKDKRCPFCKQQMEGDLVEHILAEAEAR